MAVPLRSHERMLGVLTVRRGVEPFDAADLELLTLLGDQLVPALEGARLHSELAESEAYFRSLFEGVACGVVVADRRGVIVEANLAAVAILETDTAGFSGRRLGEIHDWELFTEGGRPIATHETPLALAAASGQPVRGFVVHYTRPGQDKWIQVDCVPLHDAGGEVGR